MAGYERFTRVIREIAKKPQISKSKDGTLTRTVIMKFYQIYFFY